MEYSYEDLILMLDRADKAGNAGDAQEIVALIKKYYPDGKIASVITPQDVIDKAYIAEEGLGNADVLIDNQPSTMTNDGVIPRTGPNSNTRPKWNH